MRRSLNALYSISGALAACCIASIAALVMAQVALNIVDRISALFTGTAFGLTIPSYSDFTGFLLAAASFLALAYTLRSGGHIRVSLVTGRLPERVRHILEIATVLVALAMTLFLCGYSIALVLESFEYQDMSSGMIAVPLWIPQSAMAAGVVILATALADECVSMLRGRPPGWADTEENLSEHRAE